MGDIYRGSQCTISVTDTLDADGGIFLRRNPLFHIPLRIGHTGETLVYIPSSVLNLESSNLSTRAWTFQERPLSRRVLHMRKQLMHWEWSECSASEVDPSGADCSNLRDIFQPQELRGRVWNVLNKAQGSKLGKMFFKAANSPFVLGLGPSTKDPAIQSAWESFHSSLEVLTSISKNSQCYGDAFYFYKRWYELVAKYTGADLTQPSDRLVAIHGTAMQIQNCTGLTFLGGLWKENLHLDLLWCSLAPQPRPSTYRAPS